MASTRRAAAGAGAGGSKAASLRQLKELRESGKTHLHDYQVGDDVKIYDEVTEEQYNAIARRNILEDDFVEDDTGEGYADGGLEDWDRPQSGSSEDDDDDDAGGDRRGDGRSGRSKKDSAGGSKRKRDKRSGKSASAVPDGQGKLTDMLNRRSRPAGAATGGGGGAREPAGGQQGSNDLLASIFSDMDKDLENQIEKRPRFHDLAPAPHPRIGGNSSFNPSQPLVPTPTDFGMSSRLGAADHDHGMDSFDPFDGDDVLPPASSSPLRGHSRLPPALPLAKRDDAITPTPIKNDSLGGGLRSLAASSADTDMKIKAEDDGGFATSADNMTARASAEILEPQVKVRKLQTSAAATAKSSRVAAAANFLPKFVKEEPAEVQGGAASTSLSSTVDTAGCTSWKAIKDTVMVQSSSQGGNSMDVSSSGSFADGNLNGMQDILEADGSMLVFWFDATEKNGIVYIFGKALHRGNGRYVSVCITVRHIQRNVFVLPRRLRLDASGHQTDMEVTMADVYAEFDQLRKQHKIGQFMSRPVTRKYAFELPNIPAESEYLKVVYPFTDPELPANLCGETFSHVFGTATRALELLILKRKLMGPCWIRIRNAHVTPAVISWCKLDVTVEDPKTIVVVSDSETGVPRDPPPLVVMSIALRTVINRKKQINEIVAASALVYNKVNIDGTSSASTSNGDGNSNTTPSDVPTGRFTVLRQLNDIPIPVEFAELAHHQPVRPEILSNERGLLNYLLACIYRTDPDVLVGHNIVDFDLDVLLQRLKANNVQHWSRLGRLRRTVWPRLQGGAGGTGDSSYAERQIASGRLMCDTYRAAQDLVRAKSYSLTNLAATLLKIDRPTIDFEAIPTYFWDARKLMEMIQHCEFDTVLACKLMFNLQFLPLTKQLTNLAGNLWSRSLAGARAERNEFLLLHEFHNKKFICPDKVFSNRPSGVGMDQTHEGGYDVEGNESGAAAVSTRKGTRRKAAYAGGLVLEPKRGFYDNYVLLLDFNSLYPSIIQEYNICFTSVARTYDNDGDHLPDAPDPSVAKGILPRLLGTLVERRRAVKGLMKDASLSAEQRAQLDIRQKALKLTANSMYGCLGFSHSRFFAKPLAMLITSKGREILQSTVDLAGRMGLDVIYGDTDSIMIHTNTTDLAQVRRMGRELKTAVNKRYTLLEIEMDGLFQRMLLLNKKKYAAIVVEEEKDPKTGEVVMKPSLETKGLDLVRRDWCGLSVDASNYVLQQLFSSEGREEAVERIHQYLTKLGEEVRGGAIPLQKYIINKSLVKAPEEYADRHSQPHVVVALQLRAKGLAARAGDTIPYVICKTAAASGGAGGNDNGSIAQRARHPEDLVRGGGDALEHVDIEWYLSNQVLPPVARLFHPIEGTDSARLADCLGLDVKKYERVIGLGGDGDGLGGGSGGGLGDVQTLESQLSDEERFRDVERWTPRCLHCGETNEFEGVVRFKGQGDDTRVENGFGCSNASCGKPMPLASLSVQLRVALCAQMRRYLDQGVVCDDPACRTRTRTTSVYGRRCLAPGCRGMVSFQYSDRALYLQLQYYESLFDPAKTTREIEARSGVDIADQARNVLAQSVSQAMRLRAIVEQYAAKSARRWIDLGALFSFVSISGAKSVAWSAGR